MEAAIIEAWSSRKMMHIGSVNKDPDGMASRRDMSVDTRTLAHIFSSRTKASKTKS